jgi:hypothetical protein
MMQKSYCRHSMIALDRTMPPTLESARLPARRKGVEMNLTKRILSGLAVVAALFACATLAQAQPKPE